MALESRTTNLDLSKFKPGLIFDADGIMLLGKYSDELAAHRAKKQWIEVLHSYFLLDRERDYNLWVSGSLVNQYFVLNCSFISACGRYAFWRLVNRQAPDAENKLRGQLEHSTLNSAWADVNLKDDAKNNWTISAITRQIRDNRENARLIDRIKNLFK